MDRSCGVAPRRWRLGRRQGCSADGAARDAVDAASSPGGRREKMCRPLPGTPGTPGLALLQRRGLGGDAHPFTPSTRHVTNSASSPRLRRAAPRCAKPHETASAPRAHPPASARGQTIRALPWEDATARFLQLGFEGARRPASCTRAFLYSPTVARFDPRQAGQTLNHGFPRWPVHKPSFRKK